MIPAIYFNEQKNTAQKNCISRGLCIDFDSENIIHTISFFFINALVWHSEKSVTIQCRIFSSEVFLSSFLFFSSFFFFFDMFRTSVWRKRFCQKQKLKNTATLNATALHTLTRLVHCENTMAAFKKQKK